MILFIAYWELCLSIDHINQKVQLIERSSICFNVANFSYYIFRAATILENAS